MGVGKEGFNTEGTESVRRRIVFSVISVPLLRVLRVESFLAFLASLSPAPYPRSGTGKGCAISIARAARSTRSSR